MFFPPSHPRETEFILFFFFKATGMNGDEHGCPIFKIRRPRLPIGFISLLFGYPVMRVSLILSVLQIHVFLSVRLKEFAWMNRMKRETGKGGRCGPHRYSRPLERQSPREVRIRQVGPND
jgi:hypothetical protein